MPTDDPAATPSTADNQAPDTSIADTQAPASTPADSGETPASTPDAPTDDRAELLAAVRKVVEPDTKTPPQGEAEQAAPEPASPTETTTPAADPLDSDPTDAELAAVPGRTKARIEKLLSQRNEARTQYEAAKPAIERWTQMEGYLSRNDLAAEDVNLLLGVGAALRRGDFQAFKDGVMPYVELCNQALGITLAPDLAAKVEAGEISPDAAKELSTARVANARLEGQAKQAATTAQTAAQEAEAKQKAEVSTKAVVDWEATVIARDPDYAKKVPLMVRVSKALVAEHGFPLTPEIAVAMAKRAYDEVSQWQASVRPQPQPTKPTPSGANALNGVQAQPRNQMEAARLALERMRRA